MNHVLWTGHRAEEVRKHCRRGHEDGQTHLRAREQGQREKELMYGSRLWTLHLLARDKMNGHRA